MKGLEAAHLLELWGHSCIALKQRQAQSPCIPRPLSSLSRGSGLGKNSANTPRAPWTPMHAERSLQPSVCSFSDVFTLTPSLPAWPHILSTLPPLSSPLNTSLLPEPFRTDSGFLFLLLSENSVGGKKFNQ